MKRILAGLVLALLIASPVTAASSIALATPSPYELLATTSFAADG